MGNALSVHEVVIMICDKCGKEFQGKIAEHDLDRTYFFCDDCFNKLIDWINMDDDWINVKDRLPQQYRDVIVFYDDINRVGVNWLDSHNEFMFYKDMNVTYWMPLPEPPKENNNA